MRVGLFGEQLRQGGVRDVARGVVPVREDGAALGGRENVEAADGACGVLDRGGEQPNEAAADGLDGLAGEQIGAVVEPQPQPLARRRQKAQRVMRGVVPGDAGEAQAGRLRWPEPASSTG